MLKKFALWFIVFGLSFLVSDVFGWTEQGKAFLILYLGIDILIILVLAIVAKSTGQVYGFSTKANVVSFILVLIAAEVTVIILFATWVATKMFNVDFYVAYQIMTFGQCLYTNSKKKDH